MKKVILSGFIVLLAFIDQLSKWWMIEMFFRPRVMEADGESLSFLTWLFTFGQERFPPAQIEVMPFFNLVMVWNRGVSFGMFASAADFMPYILSAFALMLAIILMVWMKRAQFLSTLIPIAMVIAGALANVWDRLRFGAVADFLDFYWGDWHYPAFNIADCCIVLGVIGLAFDGLYLERRRVLKKESGNE